MHHRHSRQPLFRSAFSARGNRFRSGPAQSAGERGGRRIRENAPGSRFSVQRRAAAIRCARRRGEHGSAILESFLCMILIGMILFGILQLFQLALADMIAEYAAFRGARSHVVGFSDPFVKREALIKSVPASGPMTNPNPNTYPGYYLNPTATEQSLLRSYMQGEQELLYANWKKFKRFHTNYHCPDYGKELDYDCEICDCSNSDGGCPSVRMQETGIPTVGSNFSFEFVNYPLNIPLHDWLTGKDSITISSKAELQRYPAFLE